MKTSGVLFFLLTALTVLAEPKQLEGPDAREFRVTLRQIVPGGEALANGGFFALNTAPAKPVGGGTALDPKPRRETEGSLRRWTATGDIYVSGLAAGSADGERWSGWLVRDGTKTFTTVFGAYRTLPSYRVSQAPALPAAPPRWKPMGASLDKAARR